jgi:predicted RNA-binding protein Jag
MDAIQLIVKRVTQHNFSDLQTNVVVDCGGFREESEAALIERAEHLKTIAIEQGKISILSRIATARAQSCSSILSSRWARKKPFFRRWTL